MKGLFLRLMQTIRGDDRIPRYGAEAQPGEAAFDEEPALSERQLESLRKLIELLAERLGAERATTMATRAIEAADPDDFGDDAAMAFASGTGININGDEFLSIYVDWKWSGEVEWHVNRIFETLELPHRWRWQSDDGNRSIPAAFKALEEWLSPRGYHLWHVKTDGDDALAFPVEAHNAPLAKQLANSAGMDLFTLEEAEPYYGPIP